MSGVPGIVVSETIRRYTASLRSGSSPSGSLIGMGEETGPMDIEDTIPEMLEQKPTKNGTKSLSISGESFSRCFCKQKI